MHCIETLIRSDAGSRVVLENNMAKIIQIEGPSGSGKTTIQKRLREQLQKESYTVENIIEPGPLRTIIKSYRLCPDKKPWTETALFTADRFITYTNYILPRMLEKELIFLSARGFFTTIVYQGIMSGVDAEIIKKMNEAIPFPDLILICLVDGNVGHARALERERNTGEKVTRDETPERIDNITEAYKKLPEYFPGGDFKIIDTSYMDEDQVFDICYKYVKAVL